MILSDEGIEASRRAALLVGRTSDLMAGDWISRGTSSDPMWPEADVMKTLDMMMVFGLKEQFCLFQNESETGYANSLCT